MIRRNQIPKISTVFKAIVTPKNNLNFVSPNKLDQLITDKDTELCMLFRNCALAVLNTGNQTNCDENLFSKYPDFQIAFQKHSRGLKLILHHAPTEAFVNERLIDTIHDHLFAILRDLVYVPQLKSQLPSGSGDNATNIVFQILRNAEVLESKNDLMHVVCWGGNTINNLEYDYTKRVGRELGLRRFSICTGCGSGAMDGPMRGALVAHKLQRFAHGRFIGISEPGIIAAEPPNEILSDLVVMPDIEKRLEAFVRIAHGIVIFPGGAGTFEEILYVLGIFLESANSDQPIPIILTGPIEAKPLIDEYLKCLELCFGDHMKNCFKIIIDDPVKVATTLQATTESIGLHRKICETTSNFNWSLKIPANLKVPFVPTHAAMRNLDLSRNQQPSRLIKNLRCLFSGIVAGTVKPEIRRQINQYGPFEISGDPHIISALDRLLDRLIGENRINTKRGDLPCYRLNHNI